MSRSVSWRSTERLAWTEREGPGRPPGGVGPWYLASLATILGSTLGVILFSDSLCPEHRAWVQTLGTVGVAVSIAAFVALMRNSASGPVLTLAGAVAGIGIGGIDMLHAPLRGSIVLGAFSLLAVLTAWPLFVEARAAAWTRQIARDLQPVDPAPIHEPVITVAEPERPTVSTSESRRAQSDDVDKAAR
jgi:hypothetical protein